jgi:hypothetical protein
MSIPYVIFEVLRHSAICKLLGTASWSVGFGYTYIEEGDDLWELTPDQLRRTK